MLAAILLALPSVGSAQAAGLSDVLRAGSCAVGQWSIVFYERDDALTRAVLREQSDLDDRQSLRRPPVAAGGAGEAYCKDGAHDPAGRTAADLSDALAAWPVVIHVDHAAEVPLRVFGHAPDLAAWAGRPFVEVATVDWQDDAATDVSETLPDAMVVAIDFSAAVGAFHQGDHDVAIAVRPAPDAMSGLARAWLSGIPVARSGTPLFFGSDRDLFDEPPSRGGRDSFALLRDVAEGRVSPESAVRLSVPANDVVCSFGQSTDVSEIRWAGFVSGFWSLAVDSDFVLRPRDGVERLGEVLAPSRTCFAAPIVGQTTRSEGGMTAGQLSAKMETVIDATMAQSADEASNRKRLADQMVAAFAALAVWRSRAEEEREEDSLAVDPLDAEWRGVCTGPTAAQYDPVEVLVDTASAEPRTPVSLLLAAARAVSTGRVTEGLDLEARGGRGDGRWWIGRDEFARSMLSELADLDPELSAALRRSSTASGPGQASEVIAFLLDASDAEFEASLATLRAEQFGFARQSELARALLRHSMVGDVASAFDGPFSFKFADPAYERAYSRLRLVVPWLRDNERLQDFYETSPENAVRIAEIDLLNLYYSLGVALIDAALRAMSDEEVDFDHGDLFLPPPERNPWMLFAPDMSSLPEIPIPGGNDGTYSMAATVGISAGLHALIAGLDAVEAPDIGSYLAPLAVILDALYRQLADKSGADDPSAYRPSLGAERLFEAMVRGAERIQSGSEEVPDFDAPGIASRIDLLRFAWDYGLGAYVLSRLSDGSRAERIEAWTQDSVILTRALVAFLSPQDVDPVGIAADIDHRLRAPNDWPPAMRRILARLALELVADDRVDEVANRAALLAEIDALMPVASRQRLLDAGYVQAAVIGVPPRLLLASRDHGGLGNLTADAIVAMLRDEMSRFDFERALGTEPWRDVAGAAVALAEGLSNLDVQIGEGDEVPAYLTAPEAKALMDYARTISDAIPVSTEAEMLAIYSLVDAASPAEGIAMLDAALADCPELMPTLLPWKVWLLMETDVPMEFGEEVRVLQELQRSGDRFRSVYLSARTRILNLGVMVDFTPGLPTFVSEDPTGELRFRADISAKAKGPWRADADVGLVSSPYPASPAFALALELAERAMGEDAAAFALRLAVLETVAFGGAPGIMADVGDGRSEDTRERLVPHADEPGSGEVFGVAAPPRYYLAARVGRLPDAGGRLIRLAAHAESRGLDALARRIAGLAFGLVVEWSEPGAEEEVEADPETARPKEGGLHVARFIASGIRPVPEGFARDALCPPRSSDGADAEDCLLPRFARPSAPPADPAEAPCEILARQAVGWPTQQISAAEGEDCLHGLLAIDVAGRGALREADAALLLERGRIGALDMASWLDGGALVKQVRLAALEAEPKERPELFAAATRLSIARRDAPLAARFALLRVLSEAAEPDRVSLSPGAQSAARELSGRWAPALQDVLDSILESAPGIDTDLRPTAEALMRRILDAATP